LARRGLGPEGGCVPGCVSDARGVNMDETTPASLKGLPLETGERTTQPRWVVHDDCAIGFCEGVYEKTGKRYVVRMSAIVGELWPRGSRR